MDTRSSEAEKKQTDSGDSTPIIDQWGIQFKV